MNNGQSNFMTIFVASKIPVHITYTISKSTAHESITNFFKIMQQILEKLHEQLFTIWAKKALHSAHSHITKTKMRIHYVPKPRETRLRKAANHHRERSAEAYKFSHQRTRERENSFPTLCLCPSDVWHTLTVSVECSRDFLLVSHICARTSFWCGCFEVANNAFTFALAPMIRSQFSLKCSQTATHSNGFSLQSIQ